MTMMSSAFKLRRTRCVGGPGCWRPGFRRPSRRRPGLEHARPCPERHS